jgi:hypothetical protein
MALIGFTEATSNTLTLAHTLGKASAPDRALVMMIAANRNNAQTGTDPSMSYDGVAATQLIIAPGIGVTGGAFDVFAAFALRNSQLPAGAGSFNATLSWSAGNPDGPWRFFVATFDDFDQSLTPLQIISSGNLQASPPPNIALTTLASRSTIIDFLYSDGDSAVKTAQGGNTRILGQGSGSQSFHASVRPSSETNVFGQAVTMGWATGPNSHRYQRAFEFASYGGHKAIMLGTNF